jgi:hypothetical protein
LAIDYNDGGGIVMINLCGGALNTTRFRLRAQIWVPVEGQAYTQVPNSGGEESRGLAAAAWTTIDVPFGANSDATALGINIGAGGPGVSGTLYIESLEMYIE